MSDYLSLTVDVRYQYNPNWICEGIIPKLTGARRCLLLINHE